MTRNHPLLTIENVVYWYWATNPPWSTLDIADEVGCSESSVHRFMVKNNIPRRDYSDALKNSWNTDEKRLRRYERWDLLTVENTIKWYWRSTPNWSIYDIAEKVGCSVQTVLSFMEDNNIPTRDYIEAGKTMHMCPHKNIKFKKYPLLTRENVYHWYWEEDPPWSTSDIAKKVGCRQSNVCKFMVVNDIPRRNHKDAALNIFKCPSKKKNYKLSIEQKQNISRIKKEQISKTQKLILQKLLTNGNLFVSELMRFQVFRNKKNIKSVRDATYRLLKREFVERRLEYNPKSRPNCQYQYKYSINEKGKYILSKSSNY